MVVVSNMTEIESPISGHWRDIFKMVNGLSGLALVRWRGRLDGGGVFGGVRSHPR